MRKTTYGKTMHCSVPEIVSPEVRANCMYYISTGTLLPRIWALSRVGDTVYGILQGQCCQESGLCSLVRGEYRILYTVYCILQGQRCRESGLCILVRGKCTTLLQRRKEAKKYHGKEYQKEHQTLYIQIS